MVDIRRFVAVMGAVFSLAAGGSARADQCASYGPRASMDGPDAGALVPPNYRFRVWLHPSCGAIEGGPETRYRITDPTGVAVEYDVERWLGALELVARQPLAPGVHTLEARRPISASELGPWQRLGDVRVAGATDTRAPALAGIAAARTAAIAGTVALSPCHVTEDWVLWTRVSFVGARDEGDHDLLIYALERRAPGDTRWEVTHTFRPNPVGGRQLFEWEDKSGWDQTWEYRLRVRDSQGHESVGARTVRLVHPARPAFDVGAGRARIGPLAE